LDAALQGIVHRDLKPGNVLFTATRQMKLADFGLALDLNEERANTRAGTLVGVSVTTSGLGAIEVKSTTPLCATHEHPACPGWLSQEFMAPEVLACPAKRKPNENKERGVAGGQGPGREYTMTAV
jgi:serine/threonine protein kinase